jgi:hypothetical protein
MKLFPYGRHPPAMSMAWPGARSFFMALRVMPPRQRWATLHHYATAHAQDIRQPSTAVA